MLVCLHCWMSAYSPQSPKCHLNPSCPCKKASDSSCKGIGMGITHVVIHVHECTMFFQVFPQKPNVHHLEVPSGSALPLLYLLNILGVLAGVLSSVELNDSHLHTGLGGVCGVFHDVTGAGWNEVCSMLENMVDSWCPFLME